MLLAWLDDLVAIFYKPRILNLSVDIDTVDNSDLHPADAMLFNQLQAVCRGVQVAQKTGRSDNAQQGHPQGSPRL